MRQQTATRTACCAIRRNRFRAFSFWFAALCFFNCSPARAQSTPTDWKKTASSKISFDVASVKQNRSGLPQFGDSNIPLGDRDNYAPTGGLFAGANLPIRSYVGFAYKLTFNQSRLLTSQLPKWPIQDRFDIEAHAQGNPTKDQMRLMMQSLLADRFELTAHFETRQIPVFELVIAKPPQLGAHLRPHLDDPPCDPSNSGYSPDTVAGEFSAHCGGIMALEATAQGRQRMGARNLLWEQFANFVGLMGRLDDRPIVDRTGLTGTIDFVIEWQPDAAPTADPPPDESGPTFLEALQDQLGLKLSLQVDPIQILAIDHIEEPSAN